MSKPRIFYENQEVIQPEHWKGIDLLSAADVLIVCGQGVYENGIYFGEFHDRDVYFEHALRFPEIARRFHYNVVVTSGGFTQERAPWLSESESFFRILRDVDLAPPSIPVILDEAALDSAENLLLGLMTARLALVNVPIRRIGIWAAWKFKKWRFNRNAEALGIAERAYFHGFSPTTSTNVQVPPDDASQPALAEYNDDSVELGLLRASDKENKRRQRWQNNRFDASRDDALLDLPTGNPSLWLRTICSDSMPVMSYDDKLCSHYENRLEMFQSFTATWKAIGLIANGATPVEAGLKSAFLREVVRPYGVEQQDSA